MARRLGEAFTVIKADLSGFGREVQVGVERITKAIRGDVTVDAKINDAAARLGFADLRKQRDDLNKKVVSIPVDIKDKLLKAKLLDITARLEAINSRKIEPEIDLKGAARASAQMLRLEVQADALKAKLADENIGGRGGIGGKLGGLLGGAGGGVPGAVGPLPLPAIAAGIPLVGALLTEAVGLASGFAAAGAGAAAFALLAMPALTQVREAMTKLSAAQEAYATASASLNTAIHSSKADWQAYQATIHGLEPDFQSAAKLLTDQGISWQSLTPKQRASEIALRNNAKAYKLLLPDQKNALTALLKERDAWDSMTPAQQKFAEGTAKLHDTYTKLANAFAPDAFKVFNAGLALANKLLPDVTPFAKTFADVLDRLLGQATKFAGSKGFKDWLGQFHAIEGPALNAIGQGIGKIAVAAGKLLTVMSSKDVAHTINILFDVIAGAIDAVTFAVRRLMQNWDGMSATAAKVTHTVIRLWDNMLNDIAKAWDIFVNEIGLGWDKIQLTFLGGVRFIINLMAKLPGPLGAPFRRWRDDLSGIMANIQNDVRRRTGQIQSDINSIHGKNVNVGVDAHASGSGTISIVGSGWASGQGNIRFHAAAGGLVRAGSGPKADDVPAMLSKGELVVPAHMVSGGAVDHLRGRLPGFAAGGLVGGIQGAINAIPGPAGQIAGSDSGRAVHAGITEFLKLAKNAITKSMQQSMVSKYIYRAGSGVAQWRGLVSRALSMEHLSSQLVDAVLYQMQTESGGNPNAINLWDSNAARGDPSRGLMQVIGSTFRAYHWPGTSWNIYDPLANIAAALNYAHANYGPGLRNAYGGIGTGHGYAAGGLVMDRGGWLKPGWNPPIFNGTGRPEPVGPAAAPTVNITFEVGGSGNAGFDDFMWTWMKKMVVVKGGGNVNVAFGRH